MAGRVCRTAGCFTSVRGLIVSNCITAPLTCGCCAGSLVVFSPRSSSCPQICQFCHNLSLGLLQRFGLEAAAQVPLGPGCRYLNWASPVLFRELKMSFYFLFYALSIMITEDQNDCVSPVSSISLNQSLCLSVGDGWLKCLLKHSSDDALL